MKWICLSLSLLLLASCSEKKDDAWLGYAEGDEALISAPQPGWVTAMKVQRGQTIHRGDVLFVLNDTRETAGRDQAEAALAQSQAALAQAKSSLTRSVSKVGLNVRFGTVDQITRCRLISPDRDLMTGIPSSLSW